MKPITPRILGLGGLLPFVGLAAVTILDVADWGLAASEALMIYSALILSFLGGVSWGAALRQERGARFLLSMVPFFAAWIALSVPPLAGLCLLIVAFATALAIDRSAFRAGLLPRWFMGLRGLLTTVVVLSLAAVALSMWV